MYLAAFVECAVKCAVWAGNDVPRRLGEAFGGVVGMKFSRWTKSFSNLNCDISATKHGVQLNV